MMYASKSGFINLLKPSKPSLIGVASFTETSTGLKREVKVYHQFWNKHAYIPNTTEIYEFLYSEGHRHIAQPKFTWVM